MTNEDYKRKLQNVFSRAARLIHEGIVDDGVTADAKKILRRIDKHLDHAHLATFDIAPKGPSIEEDDECPDCGTAPHEGPCVGAAEGALEL
jgi:hypothetical protein